MSKSNINYRSMSLLIENANAIMSECGALAAATYLRDNGITCHGALIFLGFNPK